MNYEPMKEIACLEIEGFICIAWSVSSTRYPAASRGKTSGRGFAEVSAARMHITYALDIQSSSEWNECVEIMTYALVWCSDHCIC